MWRTYFKGGLVHSGLSGHVRALAAALSLFAVACSNDVVTPGTETGQVPRPMFDEGAPPNGAGQCMGDDALDAQMTAGLGPDKEAEDLNCTSNDIDIASATVTEYAFEDPGNPGNPGPFTALPPGESVDCTEGETIYARTVATLLNNAQARYDIGVWIAISDDNPELPYQQGGQLKFPGVPGALTGECNHYNLIPNVNGASDLDGPDPAVGDVCGDMAAEDDVVTVDLEVLTLKCEDPNENGAVDVGACIGWQNQINEQVIPGTVGRVCEAGDPAEEFRFKTTPDNSAKCNCEPFTLPINVLKTATIEVKKVCVPTDDPGTFDLEIDNAEDPDHFLEDNAECGGTTGAQTVGAGSTEDPGADHSVSESDFTAGNYFSTVACTKNGDPYIASQAYAAGTDLAVQVDPEDAVVCTFTNERKGVTVTKTAAPTLTRTYFWDIEKVADPTTVTLDPDQVYSHPYSVTASLDAANPSDDSEWAVTGNITVHNPTSGTLNVATVTDGIAGGITGDVVCPGGLPQDLASGADLVCTYSADLPDGTTRLNTATATLTNVTGSFSGTASIDFANAVVTDEDNCLTVKDIGDLGNTDPLGVVCAPGTTTPAGAFTAPKTFDYTRLVPTGSAQCGVITYNNTATGTTNTSGSTVTDSESIEVTIECPEGCTLTQGYWKTHNDLFRAGKPGGPASDPAWANVGGPGTIFFLSGQTWFQVFWTAPGGNAYYVLAHQYMAAVLNDLDGVTPSAEVTAAINAAAVLFGTYTPAQIKVLKGNSALRAQFITLAGTLGSFNEGLAGVEHCTEDATASLNR